MLSVHHHPRPWMEWEDDIIREAWDKGLTGGQIARLLHRTRNAILGRVFRLRLKERGSPVKCLTSRPKYPPKPKFMDKPPRLVNLPTRERQQDLADIAYVQQLRREAGKAY